MSKQAILILRIGLAFVLVYAAVAIYLRPADWLGFVPAWIDTFMPRKTFLQIHEIFNIFLAVWLLSNVKVFYAAVLTAITLLGIIIFNIGAMDIVFRDVGLLTAAIALAILSDPRESKDENFSH